MKHLLNYIITGSVLLLASCSNDISLTQGMTREQVQKKIGKPISTEKNHLGGETWMVQVYRETGRSSYSTSNFEKSPGESVYDYESRKEANGLSAEYGVTTSYEKRNRRISFDSTGRLIKAYKDEFITNH